MHALVSVSLRHEYQVLQWRGLYCPSEKWDIFGSNESSHHQTNEIKITADRKVFSQNVCPFLNILKVF